MSREDKNYLEVVQIKISELVLKRKRANTIEEVEEIGKKLDKLYDVKWAMLGV